MAVRLCFLNRRLEQTGLQRQQFAQIFRGKCLACVLLRLRQGGPGHLQIQLNHFLQALQGLVRQT
ncbi:hypothetical protein D3C72_1729690 [compost metagenome]